MDASRLKELTAKYPMKVLANGNIRTSPVRLSFVRLFKPAQIGDSEKKTYGVSLLFPVGADLSILRNVANVVAVEKFGNNPGGKVTSPFLNQGDEPYDGYVDGATFLRCYSPEQNQPQVVDLQGRVITNENDCPSGYWALATIRGFAYDVKLKKGVSFGIQNLIVIEADDKFSGRSSASEDFQDIIGSDGANTGVDLTKGPSQFF